MRHIAFLFPGQGSQFVGMGQEFYHEYDFVRELFDMAEDLTEARLARLCFKGPMETLTKTVHLQPAVTVVNLACLAAVRREKILPGVSAGHSLGEYAALRSAEALSDEDAIRLVNHRGELMHRESLRYKGAMSAILGLTIDAIEPLVQQAQPYGTVAIANHNTAQQIVITGEPAAVQHASELAAEKGAKAIPLKVSGAWHSELIRGAESDFRQVLSAAKFQVPSTRVVFNLTADTESDPDRIREIMAGQLCSPVRWYDSIRKMMSDGCDAFVEVGPGKVLSGIVRKVVPKDDPIPIYNVSDLASLERFLNDVA